MATVKIPVGNDLTLRFTITGEDGNAVDINNCENITVLVYQRREIILQSFSIEDSDIEIINASAGKIEVYVDRENLTNVTEAKLYCEIVVDVTNANFVDGFKRTILSNILIGELINAVNVN